MISKIALFGFVVIMGVTSKPAEEQFITTTPCHDDLRKIHNIPAGVDCSVINWDLRLSRESGKQRFTLTSSWGFYIDNRTLEKRGSAESTGTWTEKRADNTDRIILTSDNGLTVSFRKLDSNHAHVLDSKGNLAKGDDGYSFTLNKTSASSSDQKNSISNGTTITESFGKVTFAGRTPCQEIAKESNIPVDPSCFKLKWKLTLYQDSIKHRPSTYELWRTQHRRAVITGKWRIFSATINNRTETIYQLDPDKPEITVTFMKGDDNVLFFLDRNLNFLPGGKEFGYTLNRR